MLRVVFFCLFVALFCSFVPFVFASAQEKKTGVVSPFMQGGLLCFMMRALQDRRERKMRATLCAEKGASCTGVRNYSNLIQSCEDKVALLPGL